MVRSVSVHPVTPISPLNFIPSLLFLSPSTFYPHSFLPPSSSSPPSQNRHRRHQPSQPSSCSFSHNIQPSHCHSIFWPAASPAPSLCLCSSHDNIFLWLRWPRSNLGFPWLLKQFSRRTHAHTHVSAHSHLRPCSDAVAVSRVDMSTSHIWSFSAGLLKDLCLRTVSFHDQNYYFLIFQDVHVYFKVLPRK